ncbi:hypothetical protein [Leisingera sp. D0M16]
MASIFFIGMAPRKLVGGVISLLNEGSNARLRGCVISGQDFIVAA